MAKDKEPKLPEELAKEGVGLHRKPTCCEIIQSQLGLPFLKVNAVVKEMTGQEKSDVDTKDPAKVRTAYAAANDRYLEKNKATEQVKP